ncbi:MAG: helix-turn-helix transcriptional regulator [Thiolinea sp.]
MNTLTLNSLPIESRNTLKIRWNEIFFIVLLGVTGCVNLIDFIGHLLAGGESFLYLLQEVFVVIASFSGIVYLLWIVRQRIKEVEEIKAHLQTASRKLSQSNEKLQAMSQQYREVINQQFTDWLLTPSETEVAMLLLKGLSFEEIAGVRDTKEKTVRQQATAIYRKSGLNGRHEFAAWFFEDFL